MQKLVTWQEPKVNEITVKKPSDDIIKAISNIYGEDSLLAVLREIGSDGYDHGNADSFIIKWDEIERYLILSDNGQGCKPENLKYFYGFDFGEGGQSVTERNHWRLGMNAVSLIAIDDTITISNKDRVIVIKWFGEDCKNVIKLSDRPNTTGKTGVTHKIQVKPNVEVTTDLLLNKSKLLWFFRHFDENKKVIINDVEMNYDELDHPELFCEGFNGECIHNFKFSTKYGNSHGKIFMSVTKDRPNWFPDKNVLVLYHKGDFRSIERQFFGKFGSIVFVSTEDTEIANNLTAGKTVIVNYRKTDFYRTMNAYIENNFAVKEPTSVELKNFMDILESLMPNNPNDALNADGMLKRKYMKHTVKYKWSKEKNGKSIDAIDTKATSEVKVIHDEEMPFMFVTHDGGRFIKCINVAKNDKGQYVYPIQAEEFIADSQKGKPDRWLYLMSRLTQSTSISVDDFNKNFENTNQSWLKQDRMVENAKAKIKRKNKKIEETVEA